MSASPPLQHPTRLPLPSNASNTYLPMRFALTANQRDFFAKKHFLELEGLITPEQATALKQAAEETIVKRLHGRQKTEIAGYDLWREDERIKKITQKHSLAALASELFQTMPLRYGFDQYFGTD